MKTSLINFWWIWTKWNVWSSAVCLTNIKDVQLKTEGISVVFSNQAGPVWVYFFQLINLNPISLGDLNITKLLMKSLITVLYLLNILEDSMLHLFLWLWDNRDYVLKLKHIISFLLCNMFAWQYQSRSCSKIFWVCLILLSDDFTSILEPRGFDIRTCSESNVSYFIILSHISVGLL